MTGRTDGMGDATKATDEANPFRAFMAGEAAGGILLMVAAALALVVANSPLATAYAAALHHPLAGLTVAHWIDDGGMALFFLLVGLEVKREALAGQLASWRQRLLPGAAAVAGMAVPAAIFVAVNHGSPATLAGWAIPAATDIAFALAIVALLGARVPPSLKVLLTAIAVIDDLLAILVIALFYTGGVQLVPLAAAAGALVVLVLLNRTGVRALAPYLIFGAGLWYAVLLSGVHATLAGVALALAIPLRGPAPSPLARLEHRLHPWVAFLVLPLFGFANAGLSFAGLGPASLAAPLPLGILLGLALGKPLGIFAAIGALAALGLADRPAGATWPQVRAMTALCGIGFTMSLFIGTLAFRDDPAALAAVRLGVLAGSLASGLLGWRLFVRAGRR